MPGSTSKGVPYPVGTDAASSLDTITQSLAQWVTDNPGVASLTTAEIAALSGGALWVGRLVLNNQTLKPMVYIGTWVQIALTDDAIALDQVSCPAGTVVDTVRTTAPSGWLLFNGATVANAQTTYPALWAVAPASWKSGSSLVMPNAANRVAIGAGTTALGAVGGSNTHTLAAGNLPPHAHTIDHDHPQVTSSGQSANHVHGVSGNTGGQSQSHVHGPAVGDTYVTQYASGGAGLDVVPADKQPVSSATSTGWANQDHTHGFSVTSAGVSGDHSHTVDLPNFTGSSGNGPGSATAVDHTPANLGLNKMVRAY